MFPEKMKAEKNISLPLPSKSRVMVTSVELFLKLSDRDILGDPSDFRMGYNFKHRLISP